MMKTLACINVSYGKDKNNIHKIFDCSFQHKDGKNFPVTFFADKHFNNFNSMYVAILKVANINGFKVPHYKAFNCEWYAINFVNVSSSKPVFLRYGIKTEKAAE